VGWLILLAPQEISEEQVKDRITGIDAALAVLMMAVECSAAIPLSGVLSRQAFWARVASEISRSQRGGDEFTVLHVRIIGMEVCAGEELTSRWTRMARLGEALAARLRTSDVVGLTGADRLAVLFTATGRLGARIATRRIEQLLQVPENESDGLLDLNSGVPEFCLRIFPHDARDIDSLRRVPRWRSETTGSALPATRPG
jgi:GGDEF domain-containing protein